MKKGALKKNSGRAKKAPKGWSDYVVEKPTSLLMFDKLVSVIDWFMETLVVGAAGMASAIVVGLLVYVLAIYPAAAYITDPICQQMARMIAGYLCSVFVLGAFIRACCHEPKYRK